MQTIVIVDYGMGNLRSVQKGFEQVGAAAEISGDHARVAAADKVVLPGVGSFGDAMARLHEAGLAGPIKDQARAGKPLLGICLGLQLLFTRGHEDGVHDGLGLLPGEVVRFETAPGLKVPHMGWNYLRVTRPSPLLRDLPPDPAVYFVHSNYARPQDPGVVATETDYPTPFASSLWHENVFATQFHPEKSQKTGLAMLRNFARL